MLRTTAPAMERAPKPLSRRLHLLRATLATPHRFARLRAAALVVTLGGMVLPASFGVVGFDAWDGRHRWLGQRTDALGGVVSVIVGVIAFYLVTFVVNALFGRLFCGFGCPSAQLARSAERVEIAARLGSRGGSMRAAIVRTVALSLLSSAAASTWVVHPAVVVEGSRSALAATALAWLAGAAVLSLHGYLWRWRFCRTACPIGVYYTFVQTEHAARFDIHFEEHRAPCRDCGACDEICPVELEPRRLHLPIVGRGGLSFDGFPARHHCLACGDCVQACEIALRKRPTERVPLRLGFAKKVRLSDDRDAPDAPRSEVLRP